jgi:hypothetical protein
VLPPLPEQRPPSTPPSHPTIRRQPTKRTSICVTLGGPSRPHPARRHPAWLETIHLITTLPAWSRNLTRRVKRHPKIFIADPGLAAWLLGKTPDALQDPADPATGQLVETFVFNELRRQLTM